MYFLFWPAWVGGGLHWGAVRQVSAVFFGGHLCNTRFSVIRGDSCV
jgi:hypothetical protein